MTAKIYLDNNASTPLDPRVFDAIVENLRSIYGNPSSTHAFGQEAQRCLKKARQQIADSLGVRSSEIIFTSGGTEGASMVMRGFLDDVLEGRGHHITSNLEHSCVLAVAKYFEKKGIRTTFLSPGLKGAPAAEDVQSAMRSDTCLISLMAVNNETGIKTDINAIASLAKEAKIPFFVDGVGLLGKEIFTIPEGVSAMSFSGHKFHGPKGIGFVFIRHGIRLTPLIMGEQEFQRRGGTENLSGIVGLSEAVRLAYEMLPSSVQKMYTLREHFEKGICHRLSGIQINGLGPRVSNTVNIAFLDVDGESLLTLLDRQGVAASHGSACASGALEPSRVLVNMGIPSNTVRASLRFSLSRMTTFEEINTAIDIIASSVERLRNRV